MSNAKFNNKYASGKTTFGKKPFCKVCQDAGKSESEYTSHFVRSLPDSYGNTTVTCPVLAATECRYCYKKGHTAKFCPVIKENGNKADKEKSVAIQPKKRVTSSASVPKVSNKLANSFAALDDDSDDENPVPIAGWRTEIDEQALQDAKDIVLRKDKRPNLLPRKINNSIVNVPVPAVEVTQVAKGSPDGLKSALTWAAIAEKPVAPVKPDVPKTEFKVLTKKLYTSWADDSDSDEEKEVRVAPTLVRANTIYQTSEARYAADEDDDW